MPVHDWTRVDDGIFHHFHTAWITELARILNAGLLPPDNYALAEQIAGNLGPDVLTLHAPTGGGNGSSGDSAGTLAVAVAPPPGRLTFRAEISAYTLRQRTLVIRHVSNHRIIALIDILSPGNKASRHGMRTLIDKAGSALAHGIHLLIIDLHPPGPRDQAGVHGAIWQQLTGETFTPPADKPLTLVTYSAGPVKTAYVEPIAVSDVLPEMALFLNPEEYINVPLEPTYMAAYASVPRFYRRLLEA